MESLKTARLHRLDLLRAAAVLLVLGRHLPEGSEPVQHPLIPFFQKWYLIGWSGVDLFFVLSGFLVSGLLFKEFQLHGRLDLKRFFIRRGLRIYPAFYLMIAVSIILIGPAASLKQIAVEVLFLQSYFHKSCLWLHTWSLAIEEHFYLVTALLLAALAASKKQDPFGSIPVIFLSLAVFCPLLRLAKPFDDFSITTQSHLRSDALFFGVLIAYWYHFKHDALRNFVHRLRWMLIALPALLLQPVFTLPLGREPFMTRFGFSLTYLAFGCLLLLALFPVRPDNSLSFLAKPLSSLGRMSYSCYLWHVPVLYVLAQPLTQALGGEAGLWAGITVYLGGSLLAGYVSYRWVETPVLAWRDKRFA